MFYMQNRCLTEIPPLCCFGFCATPFKNARRLPRVPLNLLIQTIQGKMDSNHGGWGGGVTLVKILSLLCKTLI